MASRSATKTRPVAASRTRPALDHAPVNPPSAAELVAPTQLLCYLKRSKDTKGTILYTETDANGGLLHRDDLTVYPIYVTREKLAELMNMSTDQIPDLIELTIKALKT
jgi:hypothetical protein